MKKILLTLMAACAVFSFASAQETGFGFGVKAGVNISNQTLDDAAKYKAGFTGGIFVDYRTCNWFAVSVDVLYSRQGSKIKDSDVKLRTDYLNIPVLANFYLTRGMALKTGVQPGFLLAAKAKEGDVKVDAKNIYKTFDLSIPVGLSYDFKFGLILDARYNIGVTNLAKRRRLHAQQRVRCHGRLAILTLSSFEFARRPALFGRAGRFRFRQIIFPGTARTNGKIANLKP